MFFSVPGCSMLTMTAPSRKLTCTVGHEWLLLIVPSKHINRSKFLACPMVILIVMVDKANFHAWRAHPGHHHISEKLYTTQKIVSSHF